MAETSRSRAWDVAMILLLAGSVALVFWYEALDPVDSSDLRRLLEWVDLGLVVLFALEWAWRVSRKGPAAGRYALRYSWELLGMVPILLPLPSFLRFLRLVRLVRILRVFGKVGHRLGVWQRIAREGSLHKVGLAAGSVTLAGALLVWAVERGTPGTRIPDFETAIWWAIVTVTTVGYGDVTPLTATGRFVAACLMVTGIGTIGLLASTLASVLVRPGPVPEVSPLPVPRPTEAMAQRAALAGELERLAKLREDGFLTEPEFAAAKARLLSDGASA